MTVAAFAIAVVLLLTPAAHAEDWPPAGTERVLTYYTGTCGVSMTYHGAWMVDCDQDNHFYGTRNGRWRKTTDANCDPEYGVGVKYGVCIDGSNCAHATGTWVEISQSEFESAYCP